MEEIPVSGAGAPIAVLTVGLMCVGCWGHGVDAPSFSCQADCGGCVVGGTDGRRWDRGASESGVAESENAKIENPGIGTPTPLPIMERVGFLKFFALIFDRRPQSGRGVKDEMLLSFSNDELFLNGL